MTIWEEQIRAARDAFLESALSRGWRLRRDGSLNFSLGSGGEAKPVRVELSPRFPFSPPRAFPEYEVEASWHREVDGAMCLYTHHDGATLPWMDIDAFATTVALWVERTDQGWQDDATDMDLERYFPAGDRLLVVYDESISTLVNRQVRFRVGRFALRLVGPGVRANGRPRGDRVFGFVVDIGVPMTPPRSWEDLRAQLSEDIANKIERLVRGGSISLLLVRYHRGGLQGVVALHVRQEPDGLVLAALPSASVSPNTLRLRSGRNASLLAIASVLVVGAGAIGSMICEQLARAGVGHIAIRDGDVLRPGNLVRHAADARFIGATKAIAVASRVATYAPAGMRISTSAAPLLDHGEVAELYAEFDLIIDATASTAATAMLVQSARTLGQRLVTVCVQAEGRVVRVDVEPAGDDGPIPATEFYDELESEAFEAGCGEPVSMTPPYAAVEAAALASRVAVDVLVGAWQGGSGVVHDYR